MHSLNSKTKNIHNRIIKPLLNTLRGWLSTRLWYLQCNMTTNDGKQMSADIVWGNGLVPLGNWLTIRNKLQRNFNQSTHQKKHINFEISTQTQTFALYIPNHISLCSKCSHSKHRCPVREIKFYNHETLREIVDRLVTLRIWIPHQEDYRN